MLATLERRAVLGPRLDLRAQAGRRAGPGLPARGSGRAVVAQPQAPDRDLPRDRRGRWPRPARRRLGDRRRDRGLRPAVGPASAACSSASAWTERRRPAAARWRWRTWCSTCWSSTVSRLTDEPLATRRQVLSRPWCPGTVLALNGAFAGDGETLFAEMCARGWEGVVAKRAVGAVPVATLPGLAQDQVRATPGVRGGRLHRAPGPAAGTGCAAGRACTRATALRYAGKVGTGFSHRVLTQLRDATRGLEQDTSPFGADRVPERTAHWVRPELVAEVSLRRSGRPTVACATPPSWGCATTRIGESCARTGAGKVVRRSVLWAHGSRARPVARARGGARRGGGRATCTSACRRRPRPTSPSGPACRGPRSTAATAATRPSSWPC